MRARSAHSQLRDHDRPGVIRRPAGRSRLVVWIAAAVVAILGAGGFLTYALVTATAAAPIADRPAPDATVLTVDRIPVPVRELALYLARDRSAIVAEYQARGADIGSAAFWQTPIDGVTPARKLVAKAKDDVVRLHVQLQLAASAHVNAPQTYDQLVRAWQNENARRANALDKGQPVYGPQQFSESDFIDYLLGNLGQQAQTELAARGGLDGSDAAARTYYTAHADRFSGAFETVKQQVILHMLDEQYQHLITERTADAQVESEPLLDDLPRYSCLADGSC
ncbi:hypothetical protein [Leifsonia sp. 1010]|uniref:hypothetical protein n=1 Tax=Leifsonia sp. 1010 TaxID=2817769 RepID=UPI00285BED24|nr:hypothetical protein [Leifsonia sp. 1010]MDR6611176.1 hypothetical protein [Leifsonia sp. 1010]